MSVIGRLVLGAVLGLVAVGTAFAGQVAPPVRVPEPASLALLGLALGGVVALRSRFRK